MAKRKKQDYLNYLRIQAVNLIESNFNLYEASHVFGVDYSNFCSYLRGRKPMPINLLFNILEYFDCRIVAFKSL